MPAYPNHQDIRPFYYQSTDPGAVGAGVSWVDTSSGPPFQLKIRNSADTAWETIGLSVSDGADKSYVHNQAVASATWNVIHNLGKFPSVTVVDSSGNEAVGDVDHTDANNLVITFSASFAGKAYIN